jgi:hypothetical protein
MTEAERLEFIGFVLRGGQVRAQSLPGLVARAIALVTLHSGHSLIGTAAIKVPNTGHRDNDFAKALVKDRAAEFSYELGWVHSSSPGNGRKLIEAALAAAGNRNVYATTKTDKMLHMLPDYGFAAIGQPFKSDRYPDASLTLFVRSLSSA